MSKIDEVSGKAEKKVKGFLAGKPIWVFWITFTLMIGLAFAITYGLMNLLALRFWVLLLVVVISGMAAGTFVYLSGLPENKQTEY